MSAAAPEISVVIPCLNEEEAVGKVVDQALEGIRRSGRTGEVIVVDNASTDRSADVAAEHGATVVREERPGYGSAYLAGLAVARGDFIVMGDADETYPMQDLAPFVDRLAEGDDLVMGSRFEGTIHGEAMPWLNRHVGNPILTGLLNVLFGVKISDAHCGMRAVRKDALPTLDLHSTGMEFASEMVFKAFRRKLRVSEIPIDYYPRVGESKLNRFGDAWRHVKFMLLYSPSWLYFVPGLVLLVLGIVGALALAAGPVEVLGRTWQIHTLFLFMFAILLGTQVVQLGIFARAFAAAHLGRDRPARRVGARPPAASSTASRVGGLLLLAGIVTAARRSSSAGRSTASASSRTSTRRRSASRSSRVGTQVILGSFFLGLLTMRTTEPSRVERRSSPRRTRRSAAFRAAPEHVRICLVYDHLYPVTVGGGERWMHDLALALARERHEVTYLTMRHWTDDGPVASGCASGRARLRGLGVRRTTALARTPSRGSVSPSAAICFDTAAEFDVVHTAAFPYFPLLAAALGAPPPRYRLVADWYEVWTHSYWQRYAGRALGTAGWLVQRRCIRVRHDAFCISRHTQRRLLEEGFDGTARVLPGLYAGPVEPSPPATVEPLVVYAGSHVKEKRLPLLYAASRRPRRRIPRCGSRSTATGRTGRPRSERRLALA